MGKPAARLTDNHLCPMSDGPKPHVGGPILGPGEPTVMIGGLAAARVTDKVTCVGPIDAILMGSTTVLIGGLPAARMGDQCVHGGKIVLGCPTVLIGDGGDGGGGKSSESETDKLSLEVLFGRDGPLDGLSEGASPSFALTKKWLDKEGAVFKFGDEDNYVALDQYELGAKSEISYKAGELEVVPINVSASGTVIKGQTKQKSLGGSLETKETAEIGHAEVSAEASAKISKEGVEAKAQAGAEAIVARASAEGTLRITGKTIYDSTVGRLTNTSAPESWSTKGVEIGAKGQAGIGAAAKASASAAIGDGKATLGASASIGAGPFAGVSLNLGVFW